MSDQQYHAPAELLQTAEELFGFEKPEMYRTAVLEAIAALETIVEQEVFSQLKKKLDPLFVTWLHEKTKMSFDDRLSKLTPVAFDVAVGKGDRLWARYKKAKEIRNKVVHSGRKVSREEAREVIDTVHEWIEFIQVASKISAGRLKGEFLDRWVFFQRLLDDICVTHRENIEDQLVGSREETEAVLYGKAWQMYVRRYLQERGVQLPDRLFAIRNGLVHGQNFQVDETDIELLESAIAALLAVGNQHS